MRIRPYRFRSFLDFMGSYFTTSWQEKSILLLIFFLGSITGGGVMSAMLYGKEHVSYRSEKQLYWFLLQRSSNIEYLYIGNPGDKTMSKLIKTFLVKSGIPKERPTPLPQFVHREYWLLTKKYSSDNPETAPYFLELNVPGIEQEPYGPSPYTECNGQCNWVLPGSFGLHGVNGDLARLGTDNAGSSGCIRHTDADITMLFQLLDPENEEIRYYVRDI